MSNEMLQYHIASFFITVLYDIYCKCHRMQYHLLLFLIAIEIYTDFIGHHSTQYNISRSMYIHVEFAINAKMNCHNAMAIETSDSFVGCFLFINECL